MDNRHRSKPKVMVIALCLCIVALSSCTSGNDENKSKKSENAAAAPAKANPAVVQKIARQRKLQNALQKNELANHRAALRTSLMTMGTESDDYRFRLAQHEILHVCTDTGVQRIAATKEGVDFLTLFLNDRQWMEEFLCAGLFQPLPKSYGEPAESHAPRALDNLFAIWIQDRECATHPLYRKLATGMALSFAYLKSDNVQAGQSATAYSFYKKSHENDRLHAMFESYDAWEMKKLGGPFWTGEVDSMTWFQENVNIPLQDYAKGYGGACWIITYRGATEFGGNIQRPGYYVPWEGHLTWSENRYRNGGVCGSLSTFAVRAARAHGIAAITVGSRTHCAYTVRYKRGDWRWGFGGGTGVRSNKLMYGEWQLPALYMTDEVLGDRETLLKSNRYVWQSHIHEGKTSIKCLNAAIAVQPLNVKAWDRRITLGLADKARSKEEWMTFTKELCQKTSSYPLLSHYLFKSYHKAAGLTEKSMVLDFWKSFSETAARHGHWDKEGGKRIRSHTNSMSVHGCMSIAYKRALDGYAKELGPKTKASFMKTTMAAFKTCPAKTFDIRSWGLSKFRGADQEAWLELVLADTGGMNEKSLRSLCSSGILVAAKKEDMALFNMLSKKAESCYEKKQRDLLAENKRRIKTKKINKFMLSKGGILKLSSHAYDQPVLHSRVLAEGGGFFHTKNDDNPWAIVKLAKFGEISDVVIVNQFGRYGKRTSPMEISISMDGKTWTKIHQTKEVKAEWHITFDDKKHKARYVRFMLKKKEYFHLRNILIYGRRLE